MARQPRVVGEVESLKGLLARLSLETKLLRLEEVLRRKDWADQPRAPAGQSDGGRWVSGGGSGVSRPQASGDASAPQSNQTQEQTVADDGTRVLSIRIRAGRGDFDAQHAVTAPDGESRLFQTAGANQVIRDGVSGEVLSRSTFTAHGPVSDAIVQPAFLAAVPATIARTLELATALFTVLSARKDGFGTVLGMTVQEYKPSPKGSPVTVTWVGQPSLSDFNAACPRNGYVMALTDRVTARVKARGHNMSMQALGTRIHFEIAQEVKDLNDQNFKSELFIPKTVMPNRPASLGSVRLDLFERVRPGVVCIYDYKVGISGLDADRARDLALMAKHQFPETQQIMVIQVRPRT